MQGSSGFSIKAMIDQYGQPLTLSKALVLSGANLQLSNQILSLFPSRHLHLHELSCRHLTHNYNRSRAVSVWWMTLSLDTGVKLQTGQQSLCNTGTVYIHILGCVRLKQTRSSNQVSTLSDLSPNEENLTQQNTFWLDCTIRDWIKKF